MVTLSQKYLFLGHHTLSSTTKTKQREGGAIEKGTEKDRNNVML